jgi:hypothetical protein
MWARNHFRVELVMEHLVGQGQAVGRHDQGYDHLHAVAAFVPAVAVGAFVLWVVGRGAGKVVQKDVEPGLEQFFPALLEMPKRSSLYSRSRSWHQ